MLILILLLALFALPAPAQWWSNSATSVQGRSFAPCPSIANLDMWRWNSTTLRFECVALASTGLSDSAGLVRGAASLTVVNLIPYVVSSGTLATFGHLIQTSSGLDISVDGSPSLRFIQLHATNKSAGFEWISNGTRDWLVSRGIPSATNTALTFTNYTTGNFLGGQFTLCQNTSTYVGILNGTCTAGQTFNIRDATASTGATRVTVALGAADSAATVTVTNAGTTKSAGYQSSDGSAGVTGATCSSFKNGLCVAP